MAWTLIALLALLIALLELTDPWTLAWSHWPYWLMLVAIIIAGAFAATRWWRRPKR